MTAWVVGKAVAVIRMGRPLALLAGIIAYLLGMAMASASVEVETKNGDLDVALQSVPADAMIVLRTKNGDVTLRLPPDASAQFSAETSAGNVRTRGLALSEQEFLPRDAGGEYAAQLGTGDASVELHTENGSVLVQSVDTTALDPGLDTLSPPPSDTTVTGPSAPADTVEATDPLQAQIGRASCRERVYTKV